MLTGLDYVKSWTMVDIVGSPVGGTLSVNVQERSIEKICMSLDSKGLSADTFWTSSGYKGI